MHNYTEDKRLLLSYAMYSGGNKWKIIRNLLYPPLVHKRRWMYLILNSV